MHPFWIAAIAVFVLLEINVLFTSVYLHRAMSHRSVILKNFPGLIMRMWLWFFAGQSMRSWVAVHRKHHQFSDQEGDPHSPYLLGLWKLFWQHEFVYARAASDPELLKQYTRGIPPSRFDWLLERGLIGLITGLTLVTAAFWLLLGGWTGVLLGAFIYLLQLVLYLKAGAIINALCHMFGYRNFKDNLATNLWWAGWFIAGEGWHNNHHHDLSSPKLSYKWYEFDPAWVFIKILVALKMATVLKTINQKRAFTAPKASS